MKKTIIILAAMLIGVYGGLSTLGSGDEYTAERLLYHARMALAKIAMNPDVAPPAIIAGVERDLNNIIKEYPKTKAVPLAYLRLTEFYLYSKKYDKALSTLNTIMAKYKNDAVVLSRAQFLKGLVYERQNKWDAALREYAILRDKYAATPIGLSVPIYIGSHYLQREMQAEADEAYNRAVLFYRKLEIENRGKALGYAASNMLMQAHMHLKQYEEAGKVVEAALNNYPLAFALQEQLSNVEMIFVRLLKRPEKAVEIFNTIKGKTEDPKLKKFLEERISTFKKRRLDKKITS